MSLLNSSDPYFLMGAQVLGAPIIKKFGLEPIPLGYIIVGEGGAVSVVAGSGVGKPVPSDMARAVKNVTDLPLIVGGGIRTGEQVKEIAKAGADIVVTGTVLEENKGRYKIRELVDNMKVHKKTR